MTLLDTVFFCPSKFQASSHRDTDTEPLCDSRTQQTRAAQLQQAVLFNQSGEMIEAWIERATTSECVMD